MHESKCNENCDCDNRSLQQLKELLDQPRFHAMGLMIGIFNRFLPNSSPTFFHFFPERMKKSMYDMMVEARRDREKIKSQIKDLQNTVMEAREYSKTAAHEKVAKDIQDEDLAVMNLPWHTIEDVQDAMDDPAIKEAVTRWIASQQGGEVTATCKVIKELFL